MDLDRTTFYRFIVRIANRLLLSREETEDVAAILIEKHSASKNGRELACFLMLPLTSHMTQDVKCDILDYKRSVGRRQSHECTYLIVGDDAGLPKSPVCCFPSEQIDRHLLLLALLERLSPDQSVCIILRYFDQLDTKEIASQLGLTPDSVGKRIQRGLRRLRQEWEADDANLPMPRHTKRSP